MYYYEPYDIMSLYLTLTVKQGGKEAPTSGIYGAL